jgi:ankyrin repeat protein
MTKDSPLHCAVLNRDSESFETLLKDRFDVNAVDKGGRTVMHIIAKCTHKVYGGDQDIEDFILKIFDYRGSLDTTNCVLQWTPLQYAIQLEAWFIVERLLERNVNRSGLNMIRQLAHDTDYIYPIIIESAQLGYMLLLEFICSIGVKINQASDLGFPSPLHFAIKGKHLPVVKCLIKHGADCNTRYSDGQTPLFYAVTEGSLDVVRALVEEGGASLDVFDDCGRTVIDWVNDYASNIINLDSFIERLMETVTYMRERGCEETSSVRQINNA